MKKKKPIKKLRIQSQKVRALSESELAKAGGALPKTVVCIPTDTCDNCDSYHSFWPNHNQQMVRLP